MKLCKKVQRSLPSKNSFPRGCDARAFKRYWGSTPFDRKSLGRTWIALLQRTIDLIAHSAHRGTFYWLTLVLLIEFFFDRKIFRLWLQFKSNENTKISLTILSARELLIIITKDITNSIHKQNTYIICSCCAGKRWA